MKQRDLGELVLLAAIWGGSFLFMRVSAPEFGALPLAGVRVVGASLVLLPLLLWRRELSAMLAHWKPILAMSLFNSALPFAMFCYAALHINAGLSSIFNASTPLWTALVAFAWMGTRLSGPRTLGLLVGFAGVFGLAFAKAGVKEGAGAAAVTWSVLACIGASFCYGIAANMTKKYLSGVPTMAVAAGSQIGATLWLIVPTLLLWPAQAPSSTAWANAAMLAMLCTGAAYVLFFRLIANTGPSNAVTVTYLIPVFAIVWGGLFLGEAITLPMIVGGAVILLGTGLATGLIGPRKD